MNQEDIYELCLKEMFLRVGLVYPDLVFTSDPEWFRKKQWTLEAENSFRKWMIKFLCSNLRRKGWQKKQVEFEVAMFILNYGWKVNNYDNSMPATIRK